MLYGTSFFLAGEVAQAVCPAVEEHTEWGDAVRGQCVCPPTLLSVVVGLCRAESVALLTQIAPHPEGNEVARYVGTRHVITLLFDVGLLRAVRGWVLALACTPLLRPHRVATERGVALVKSRATIIPLFVAQLLGGVCTRLPAE